MKFFDQTVYSQVPFEFVKESRETFENSKAINPGQIPGIPPILAGVYLIDSKSKCNHGLKNN
jgi:hypothetical protein